MIDVSKIKKSTGQTEASVYMTGNQTTRSLDPTSVQNINLDFTYDNWSADKIKSVFNELLIRFDTAPQFYTKQDYEHLIRVICNGFYTILEGGSGITIDDTWDAPASKKVPSSRLVKDTTDQLEQLINAEVDKINSKLTSVDNSISEVKADMVTLTTTITDAYTKLITDTKDQLQAEINGKADKNHTHNTTDINDFETEVQNIINNQTWWEDIK